MSCSQKECLQTAQIASTWHKEQLRQQLNTCNTCVMYRCGGIKASSEPYERATRSTIGMLYARKCFQR